MMMVTDREFGILFGSALHRVESKLAGPKALLEALARAFVHGPIVLGVEVWHLQRCTESRISLHWMAFQ